MVGRILQKNGWDSWTGLGKTLGKYLSTFEDLHTLSVNLEIIINARPLPFLEEDELSPITLNHLIFGWNICNNSDNPYEFYINLECTKQIEYLKFTADRS